MTPPPPPLFYRFTYLNSYPSSAKPILLSILIQDSHIVMKLNDCEKWLSYSVIYWKFACKLWLTVDNWYIVIRIYLLVVLINGIITAAFINRREVVVVWAYIIFQVLCFVIVIFNCFQFQLIISSNPLSDANCKLNCKHYVLWLFISPPPPPPTANRMM